MAKPVSGEGDLYYEQLLQDVEKIKGEKLQVYVENPDNLPLTFLEEMAIRPGFHGVANLIFSRLDLKNLVNCMMVAKSFKIFIEKQRFWLLAHLDFLETKPKLFSCRSSEALISDKVQLIIEAFPEWKYALKSIRSNATSDQLEAVLYVMKRYFNNVCGTPYCPIERGVGFMRLNNPGQLEEMLNSMKEKYGNDCGATQSPFEFAMKLQWNLPFFEFCLTNELIGSINGKALLYKAVVKENHGLAALILKYAKEFQIDKVPLETARKSLKLFQLLIEKGLELGLTIDIHKKNDWENGRTLMHKLVHEGQADTIDCLLAYRAELGLDLTITDIHNDPTLVRHRELFPEQYESDDDVLEFGPFFNPVEYARLYNNKKVVEVFAKYGLLSEVPQAKREAHERFYKACFNGDLKTVESMIENKKEIQLDLDVFYGEVGSPLHAACFTGQYEIVRLLLSKKDSNEIQLETKMRNLDSDFGHNPRELAQIHGYDDIADILEWYTADLVEEDGVLDMIHFYDFTGPIDSI